MYSAYASANKDQMKIWKSARKPLKDGAPEPPTTKVMLHVRTTETGMIASLTATNSYQLMQRKITVEDGYEEGKPEIQTPVPMDAIQSAEKLMPKKGGRALFFDQKIEVHEILMDEDTMEEADRIIGSIPFLVQQELFKVWDDALHREADAEMPEKIVQIDASVLKPIVEQLHSGDARVFITLRMRGENDALLMTAFDGIEDEELRAVIMPIKS